MNKFIQRCFWHFASRARPLLSLMLPICLIAGPSLAQDDGASASSPPKYLTLLGIHSATVAPRGLVFGSISNATNLEGNSAQEDTSVALGFGLGDANDGIGLQITASGTAKTDTFDSFGYFGIKASRRVQAGPAPTYAGLALDRLGGWGEASGTDPAATLVFTKFANFSAAGESFPVMVSIGAGTHVKDLATEPGAFLGAGIGVSRNVGLSAAWNGDYTDIGTAFKFGPYENLKFSVSVSDAFNEADRQQVSLGISWFYNTAQRR